MAKNTKELFEQKAYEHWTAQCVASVKTMGDAMRLIHECYRRLCYDEYSKLGIINPLPEELTLNYAGWMLDQMKENADTWPSDKLNRWLGFVQGILVLHGATTVDDERKRTRPIFHALYHREGIIPPALIEKP